MKQPTLEGTMDKHSWGSLRGDLCYRGWPGFPTHRIIWGFTPVSYSKPTKPASLDNEQTGRREGLCSVCLSPLFCQKSVEPQAVVPSVRWFLLQSGTFMNSITWLWVTYLTFLANVAVCSLGVLSF